MLNLYWHTIRHLRFQQIFYQVFYRLKKTSIKNIKTTQINDLSPLKSYWPCPAACNSSLSDDLEFFALNLSANIDNNYIWNSTQFPKLWLYNLHYFDVLRNDHRDIIYRKYIELWLQNNKQGHGCGWDPYPISIRVVNWIKWFSESGNYEKNWLDSLFVQAEFLYKRIEYHLLGNHIFANAKALIFLGSFFTGHRAEAWLDKGLQILKKELKAQFLADGGHFELSPMYHSILLWDICDLISLSQQTKNETFKNLVPCLEEKLKRGLIWLNLMCHPDEDIAFFNDTTFGIAPNYKDIVSYAKYLHVFESCKSDSQNFCIQFLVKSGYYIVNLPENSKAILDIGKIGAEYQPGHAHADTLSFELSLFKQRFIVNSGISEYGLSDLRLLQRSTYLHNTVNVNSRNSSEIWHGFRVARRANPKLELLNANLHKIIIQGSHDGYRTISPLLKHRRLWEFTKKSLLIIDKISEKETANEARFYLHPMVNISDEKEGFKCSIENKDIYINFLGADKVILEDSFWYPGFGKKYANKCLVVKFSKTELQTHISW